jgi:hypothetical protein
MLEMFIPFIGILIMGLIIITLDEYSRENRITIPTLILWAVCMVMGVYVSGSLIIDAHRDKKVVSIEPMGKGQSAQFMQGSFMRRSATQITSDKGVFIVEGAFQLVRGNELFLEKRASGKSYICDHKTSDCNMVER